MTDFQLEKLLNQLRELNYNLKKVADAVNNVAATIGWIAIFTALVYWAFVAK